MAKHFGLILGLIIGLAQLCTAQGNDTYAKKILDDLSKKYDGYKTIISEFSFKVTQAQGEPYQDAGTLRIEKSTNKYRIKLSAQDMISDGTSVWTIMSEDKEVQVTEADNSGTSIGPNNLFTFYKTGFKYVSANDEKLGNETLKVVELSPIDTESNYFKIKLRINKNNHIHDVTIFDKGGSQYTYSIKTLFVNNTIEPHFFQFKKDKYPGYEIVDLR